MPSEALDRLRQYRALASQGSGVPLKSVIDAIIDAIELLEERTMQTTGTFPQLTTKGGKKGGKGGKRGC